MPEPAPASRVVVAVFDGLRADLVTPGLTPNILRLAARGTWFREARSVFPSVTRVATTSIATGGPPAVHGIMGNAFYHPAAFRDRVLDTSRAADLRRAEDAHAGRFVAAATFGDQLALAGRSLAVVHTGTAGSAHVINPRARANGHWTFSVHGVAHTQTPEAVTEMVAQFGPLPARELPRFADIDYAARVMVEHVLPSRRPDVALVWFNEPDTTFHYRTIGHPDSRAVLQAADAAFGRILDWVEAQPDAERIAVIAASDHGHVATSGVVPLADDARAAGFAIAEKEVPEGGAIVMTGGRHGEVRLLDPAPGDLGRIAAWLMERPEISHLFSRAQANGVDGIVPGTLAFDLVDNDHERQPDLGFVLRASDAVDADGLPGMGLMTPGDVPLGGGMHGGLHPGELNTVLVVSAPGAVAQGAVSARMAGLFDIGPTILDLVGAPRAASMRGTSLAREARGDAAILRHGASAGRFSQEVQLVEQDGRRYILRG
ncbi:MAG: alkaline phosphatase family protein [Alsobacter sp.]